MTTPDCRTCGACCRPEPCRVPDCGCAFDHAYVSPEDVVRLPVVYQRHVRGSAPDQNLGVKWSRDGWVCVALRGTIGGEVRCACYEQRPEVCRTFQPGSEECRWARGEAGLEVEERAA